MAVAPDHLREAEERQLLRRLAAGDKNALTSLYTMHERRLYAFCHRMVGNPDDAADLVQETFLRTIRRLPELDLERLNLNAYLRTTARNLFYKQAERAKRVQLEERMEDVAPASDVLEIDPERATLLASQAVAVRDANLRLAPRQRMALAMREIDDASYAEIGEALGLNENAVAQLISRARIRLREELRVGQLDRSALPPEVQAALPALAAYVDGQLKGEKRAAVEELLARSPEARAVVDAYGDASTRYRALVPAVPLALLGERVAHAAEAEGLVRDLPNPLGGDGDPAGQEQWGSTDEAGWGPAPGDGTGEVPVAGAGRGAEGGRKVAAATRWTGKRIATVAIAVGALLAAGGTAAYVAVADDEKPTRAVVAVVATGEPSGILEEVKAAAATTAGAEAVPSLTEGAGDEPDARSFDEVAGDVTTPPGGDGPETVAAPETTGEGEGPSGTTGQNEPEPEPEPGPESSVGVDTPEPPATTVGGLEPVATTPPVTTAPEPPPPTEEPPVTTAPPSGPPNLVVSLSGTPAAPSAGPAVVTWTAVVTNIGETAAGPSQVALRYGSGGAAQGVGALAPGGSATVVFRATCPGRTDTAAASADDRGAVAESNENDNFGSATTSCR